MPDSAESDTDGPDANASNTDDPDMDELESLEEAVDDPQERQQVRDTMRVARRVQQPGTFGQVIRGFDRRDAAEALVGSVLVGVLAISYLTALVLLTGWGRVEWTTPWLATCQVTVASAPMAVGAALGDILPGS